MTVDRGPLAPGVLREALIDSTAISENTRRIAALTGVPVIGVVKADGYGHGSITAARAALAGGADMIGVTELAEAFALREAGITAPVLSWQHAPGVSFAAAVAADISLGIGTIEQLDAAAAAGTPGRPARVHLKLDTGLSRNGFAPESWGTAFEAAAGQQAHGVLVVDGVFSHLSGTSAEDDLAALAVFHDALALAAQHGVRPRWRHIAATAAALTLPTTRLDAVRIGIGLYGLSPVSGRTSSDFGLRPAMTLRASVAAVRRVPAQTGLSYGYTYRTDRETTLALIPAGYADGVPRLASNRGRVRIGDAVFGVAGRIAMDQFIVDVGDARVSAGDVAVLFGDGSDDSPTADDWAVAAETINYEIVTRIGARVPRREVR